MKKASPAILSCLAAAVLAHAEEVKNVSKSIVLPTLVLQSQETANERSAATYTTAVSNLEFDPRIDLQSRNMAEAQGDITIRGGIFENTGIRVGSATLIDPQTGHYFAELPIAPEMLEPYQVFTGADNALYGFNSTVGTISYGWSEIETGGSATAGAGDHNLNFQRLHQGWMTPLGDSGEWSLGVEAEYSRSESDGTIKFGDHDFYRCSGRVQLVGPNSQTDFFAGYQEKFFGWFAMYAAPFGSFETENLKTRLFMVSHKQNYGENSWFEATAYHRDNSDHYLYDRNIPSDRSFVHDTEVTTGAISGKHRLNDSLSLNYSGQFSADEIESTNLENSFTSRSYQKISLVPEYSVSLGSGQSLILRAGLSYFDTNRNESEFSPLGDITWKHIEENGDSQSIYLSYAENSQVSGYTAVGGPTGSGLFRGNPELDTETSKNLEMGTTIEEGAWSLNAALFYRWDDDLTDWTYDSTSPTFYVRAANPVDIETLGFELIATRQIGDVELIGSYTYLHKDEDYGSAAVDASFYALNFAQHRVTLGGIWRPVNWFEFRIDNEWRDQRENDLRNGDDSALFTHIGVSFYPPQVEGLEIFLAGDNVWEEDFEDVPGTPGRGDQYSGGVRFSW
ncbi:TonB-dependent receptor [Coraliomargarita sinensis]|uniref:TonB-dependent receptor n=1 Tax=Coraliomargarita sinensis TaxID=2174842 RepID=A0A317ZLP0_9BACT|nr:TonB-dependent receptor [Coraliomargarita sinensis]PXA04739.1 TonB-dependent receptor [Coraliomargarita sinensis]